MKKTTLTLAVASLLSIAPLSMAEEQNNGWDVSNPPVNLKPLIFR